MLLALWAGRSRPSALALVVLAVAFVSPLCALSSALFSARVLYHVLLVAVAAPLLALARPTARPQGVGLPFLLATAALWLWHAPPPTTRPFRPRLLSDNGSSSIAGDLAKWLEDEGITHIRGAPRHP